MTQDFEWIVSFSLTPFLSLFDWYYAPRFYVLRRRVHAGIDLYPCLKMRGSLFSLQKSLQILDTLYVNVTIYINFIAIFPSFSENYRAFNSKNCMT